MSGERFFKTTFLLTTALAISISGSGCGQTCQNGSCDDTINGADALQGSDTATTNVGNWIDTGSGLMWQGSPSSDTMTWQQAMDYCNDLTLDDYDDWRLPTINELRSLIRGCPATVTGGSCGATDGCLAAPCWGDGTSPCVGCTIWQGPGDNGCYCPEGLSAIRHPYLWSSSSEALYGIDAWVVSFDTGAVSYEVKDNNATYAARCVRSGSSDQ